MNTVNTLYSKKQLGILGLIVCCLFILLPDTVAQKTIRKFGTHSLEQKSFQENVLVQQNKRTIEQYIALHKNSISLKPAPVLIPLVFHIIHNNESERISEAQVWSQIEGLNKDFSHQQIRVQHLANEAAEVAQLRPEEIPIQFCLAVDEDKTAINYVSSIKKEWGLNDAIKSAVTDGCNPWDTEKYLNVWVTNLADSVSGFSTMPWSEKSIDGIVIDYEFFGTMGTAKAPFSGGATLTHLLGNYLGLANLWSSDCKDDGIFDTPIHNSPNRGCPGVGHISLCHPEEANKELHMNFMDNTDDACMYMFTYGQMQRMYLMLSQGGPRYNLVKNTKPTECKKIDGIQTAEERSNFTDAEATISKIDLQIIPNPADSKVSINVVGVVDSRINLVVYSALGKVKAVRNLEGQTYVELNTSDWESGTYFIHYKSKENAKTYQLMITH